ncbi:MAG TPA: hypothetical protein VN887_04065 [Candidatus Angelobacter sp.]|nr:hypothetical protein [Candidatus Angelobacter sp.]
MNVESASRYRVGNRILVARRHGVCIGAGTGRELHWFAEIVHEKVWREP